MSRHSLKQFSFALLLALALSPLPSLAAYQQSSTCSPDDVKVKQICPFDKKNQQTTVEIGWDLVSNFSGKAFCTLQKYTLGNAPNYTPGWEDQASYKDANKLLSTLTTDTPLKAIDSVLIRPTDDGGIYRTACCDLDPQITGCKTGGKKVYSPERVVGLTVPCEKTFSSIVNSLNNNQPTVITETDFKSWSGEKLTRDFADWPNGLGGGSGDKVDIAAFMLNTQCLPGVAEINLRDETITNVSLSSLKKLFDINGGGNPLPLFYFQDSGVHVTILVGITKNNSANYSLRVLAPESIGEIREFSCRPTEKLVPGSGLWIKVVRCIADDNQEVYLLDGNHVNFQYHTNLNTLINNKVRPNPAGWVETNHSDFTNFSSTNCVTSRKGVCAGWVDFNLRVAYLGTFSGEDYHPNDGKLVGKDCDANHYPIKKSAWIEPVNWLGNIFSAWPKSWLGR